MLEKHYECFILEMMEQSNNKIPNKALSIIALCLALFGILLAVIFDFVIFKDAILQFIAALILPVIAFFVLFVAMIVSFLFVFGIFLVDSYGFWPLPLAINFFKAILNDIKVTNDQLMAFRVLRFFLIIICVTIMVLSIVSKNIVKNALKQGIDRKLIRGNKGRANAALVLAILGLIVSIGALAITLTI